MSDSLSGEGDEALDDEEKEVPVGGSLSGFGDRRLSGDDALDEEEDDGALVLCSSQAERLPREAAGNRCARLNFAEESTCFLRRSSRR